MEKHEIGNEIERSQRDVPVSESSKTSIKTDTTGWAEELRERENDIGGDVPAWVNGFITELLATQKREIKTALLEKMWIETEGDEVVNWEDIEAILDESSSL